jgi:translation initiation factor 1
VTLIQGLSATETDLEHLLKQLKDHCGAGGRIDGGALEIQGDQLESVRRWLSEIGYRLKG